MNLVNRSMGRLVKVVYNKAGQVDKDQVFAACELLEKGAVVAIPTDTIYGLAAKADNSQALDRIYRIKERDLSKPLSVCISSPDNLDQVTEQKLPQRIIRSLLPGPITVLLKRGEKLNKDLNPGVDTIGIRVPDHSFIIAISHMIGPLALTSANRSGDSSPLRANEFEELWPELDCVYDVGLLRIHNEDDNEMFAKRLGSTVVDLSVPNVYKIVREGCAFNRTINSLKRLGYREAMQQGKEA